VNNTAWGMSDLWLFNGTRWQIVNASDSEPYCAGNTGQRASGRSGAAYWTSMSGSKYIFGGYGYGYIGTSCTAGRSNEMWKDMTTLVGGTLSTLEVAGVYYGRGVKNKKAWPGARDQCSFWVNAAGNGLIFGGYGHDNTTSTGYLGMVLVCFVCVLMYAVQYGAPADILRISIHRGCVALRWNIFHLCGRIHRSGLW
jgi:hypothetical protein